MRRITHLSQQGSLTPLVTIETAITAFYRRCEARNLSSHTVSFYKYRFQAFQRYLEEQKITCGIDGITPAIIRDFLASEVRRVSSITADDSYVTLRAFFRYLEADEVIEKNPMKGIERLKLKKTLIVSFTLEQIEAMLAVCDKSFVGIRDRAVILTMVDCGLRVSELVTMKTADINWTDQTMLVLGKGKKERIVPYGRTTHAALIAYWQRRGDIPNAPEFFLTCYGDAISRRSVKLIVQVGRKRLK